MRGGDGVNGPRPAGAPRGRRAARECDQKNLNPIDPPFFFLSSRVPPRATNTTTFFPCLPSFFQQCFFGGGRERDGGGHDQPIKNFNQGRTVFLWVCGGAGRAPPPPPLPARAPCATWIGSNRPVLGRCVSEAQVPFRGDMRERRCKKNYGAD